MFAPWPTNLPAVLNDAMLAASLTNQGNKERLATDSPSVEEPHTSPAALSESSDPLPQQASDAE
jgi:hypothetical protein